MARVDELSQIRDNVYRQGSLPPVSALPAEELFRQGTQPVSAGAVAAAYGVLVYYTDRSAIPSILATGRVGRDGIGCWLTPTPYAACMVGYDIGVSSPRDVCLFIDPARLQGLWGPGTAAPSWRWPTIWGGGGVEFFSASPIPLEAIIGLVEIEPCGDRHR